jgi:DNA-binding NtrC family response regulator
MAEPYVLVVEDDPPVRELLVRWLTMMGYSALAVENADEAISTIAREQPFAVITDVVMPVHDGLWLLEQIHHRWPALAVIMSSGALLDEEAVRRARRLGAIDFIPKPFVRASLDQALHRATHSNY